MQYIIKKYDNQEKEQLNQLLHLCFEDEYLLNIVGSSNLKFAYSAFCENKLVGFIIAWTSSFHPYCTYFRILSNPLYSKLKIEEKLLSTLEKLEEINFPIQTSIWETSVNLKRVYENNGFKEIRRTYMPKLTVSDIKEELPDCSNEYRIITLAEVLSNRKLMDRLTHVVKDNYEKTHIVNPVASVGVKKWRELIVSDDIIANGSFIYVDKNENNIIAYSFLHESDKKNSFELGWCGVSNNQKKNLVPQLIFQQIKYCIKKDVKFIIGEFDTTDQYALEVLQSFPFAPCPTWITYQKM
ncbi:hypothetical protein P4489_18630 [Heyndrickxia sporothermodurans]|uniref:hypothetical protein n=1 Tax=Heyndrickxia sporothermodurans TaxID=46224 RepID=UPI002E1E62C2|nr:hypothetical protein [Heyndrickxia sporothermodurans]